MPPALGERLFGTVFGRFVIPATTVAFGQVDGFDEPSRVIVRILVAHAVAQSPSPAVVRVPQLRRHRSERVIVYVGLCPPPSERDPIRLGRKG
jgi:hypothetical protein